MKKFLIIIFFALVSVTPVFGQIKYQTLAPIPGIGAEYNVDGGGTALSTYLNIVYTLGVALCVGLAVLMIVIGGVQWASSDAWGKKQEGKDRIWSAVLGLLIALGSYMILNTINPKLLNTVLKIEAQYTESGVGGVGGSSGGATTGSGGTGGSGTQNPGGTNTGGSGGTGGSGTQNPGGTVPEIPPEKSELEVRNYFAQNGININHANPCQPGQTTGCTNLAGLGDNAMTGLVALKNSSGAQITISGGTEDGHQEHGVSKSVVDLRQNETLNNYIRSNSTGTENGRYVVGNATYLDEGDHWHVTFK